MTGVWSRRKAAIALVIGLSLILTVKTLAELDSSGNFLRVITLNLLGAGFSVIVICCLPFLMLSKVQFLCALKDLSLPIGLVMSCFALVVYMGDLNQPFYIACVLPAVAGGMVALTLSDEGAPQDNPALGASKASTLLLWILVVCNAFHLLIYDGDLIWLFLHPWEWLSALLLILLFCLYNPKKAPIFQRIGLGAVASIILAVSLSTIGVAVATQSGDPVTHGESIALGIIGTVYGLWFYISSIVIGSLTYGFSSDTKRTNWHLAEIFTFFIFLNLAPRALTEYMEPKQVIGPEQTIQSTKVDSGVSDTPSDENSLTNE